MDIFDVKNLFSPEYWLLVAFLAPFFWSLVNVIDAYFVGGVYKDEADGSIISSLFQIVPWIFLFPLVDLGFHDGFSASEKKDFFSAFLLLLGGGILFSASFYFYFKALFNWNDTVIIQLVPNLAVILVPFLTFVMLGEKLEGIRYAGMFWIFLGASVLTLSPGIKIKISKKYLSFLILGVVFLSVSLVMEGKAYSILGRLLPGGGFWAGFLFFSVGCLFWGLILAVSKRRNILPLVAKYWKIFLLAEGLSFFGTMASQRAVDISPSVAFVSAIDATSPIFIMVFSFLILVFNYFFKKKDDMLKGIYQEQISGVAAKSLSFVAMIYGVYLLGS